jgi:hypothetical protein
MMAARVVTLEQRCPSSKSHKDKVTRWALEAGVQPSDLERGGRYAALMATMIDQMKAGEAKESISEACEAIKKYD